MMHYQHRNPQRERDHRISLMPIERTTAQGSEFLRPIRSLADEASASGMPPIWKGMLILAPFVILLWFLGVVS